MESPPQSPPQSPGALPVCPPPAFAATVLTLFPEMFPGPLGASLAGKALKDGRWLLETVDIRGFASDKHRTVDDAPFGGGAGMVMRPDVIDAALSAVCPPPSETVRRRPLVYFTPRGKTLDQQDVRRYAAADGLVMLCGRYEGVDQRVLDYWQPEEVSVGDFILSGGEVPALVLLDAVVRLLPGVMGNQDSGEDESFESGLLEYPLYTRPAEWRGRAVPEVLLSGHHANVTSWRREQAEAITRQRRPDLWSGYAAVKKNDQKKG